MKDEIRKVLEMTKSGALNEEQGAALIEELMKKEAKSSANPRSYGPQGPQGTGWFAGMGSMVADIIRGATSFSTADGAIGAKDSKRNEISMSKLDSPSGSDFVFEGN